MTGDQLKQILREATAYCHAHGMEISFTSPGWVDVGFCNELGMNDPACGACLSNMAVTPGGHAVPCQSWLNGCVLGDMRSDAWEYIWDGEKCAAIRANSAKMDGSCPLRKRAGSENPSAPGMRSGEDARLGLSPNADDKLGVQDETANMLDGEGEDA